MSSHRVRPLDDHAYAVAARQDFVGKASSPAWPRFAAQGAGDASGNIGIVGGDTPGIQGLGPPVGQTSHVEASGSGG